MDQYSNSSVNGLRGKDRWGARLGRAMYRICLGFFWGEDSAAGMHGDARLTAAHLQTGWQLISVWVIVLFSGGDGRDSLKDFSLDVSCETDKHQPLLRDICQSPEVCFYRFTQKWALFEISNRVPSYQTNLSSSLFIYVFLIVSHFRQISLFLHLSALIHWWM